MARRGAKLKRGLPPGTLIYTGKKQVAEPNVTLVQYDHENIREKQSKDAIPDRAAGDLITWFDIRGLQNIHLIEQMGELYNIHPLVLEDIVDVFQRPKFEEYETGFFIVLQALRFDAEECRVITEQVSLYLGENLVLTFQEDEDDLFQSVRERLNAAKGRIRKRKSDYLVYALLDTVVDNYTVVLEQLENQMEEVENEILEKAHAASKERIHLMKLNVLKVRKAVAPLREAVNKIIQSDHRLIQSETLLFFRDLYDHIIQGVETADIYRDMLNGLYDLYQAEIGYKMNSIMQVLTIISTIFIPLSFLAAVYGMNFDHMPELHWKYAYLGLWALMLLTAAGLLYYFRQKKWL